VNLGAGTVAYESVYSFDGAMYSSVDVVCDLARLPIKDCSVDSILSVAVLEHVPNPQQHVKEFFRILKPNGHVLCYVPFMQPFHASPHDYQRFTHQGLRALFQDFEIDEIVVGAGPTSGLVWVVQEWLALVLSLGNTKAYTLWQIFLLILSPLKMLDLVVARHPKSQHLASGFFVCARKMKDQDSSVV
jgi:SAM-dependent methyltransferase